MLMYSNLRILSEYVELEDVLKRLEMITKGTMMIRHT